MRSSFVAPAPACTIIPAEVDTPILDKRPLVPDAKARSTMMQAEDVASAIFTVTEDLEAQFPAVAARGLPEWKDVPLLCTREIPVAGSLGHCIRVLIHWNTDRPQSQVRHVFLRGARHLRPEWSLRVPGDEEEAVRLPRAER